MKITRNIAEPEIWSRATGKPGSSTKYLREKLSFDTLCSILFGRGTTLHQANSIKYSVKVACVGALVGSSHGTCSTTCVNVCMYVWPCVNIFVLIVDLDTLKHFSRYNTV